MSFCEQMRRDDEVQNRRFERALRIANYAGVENAAQDRLLDALEGHGWIKPAVIEDEDPENWDGLS